MPRLPQENRLWEADDSRVSSQRRQGHLLRLYSGIDCIALHTGRVRLRTQLVPVYLCASVHSAQQEVITPGSRPSYGEPGGNDTTDDELLVKRFIASFEKLDELIADVVSDPIALCSPTDGPKSICSL